jgi:hypothetical protein
MAISMQDTPNEQKRNMKQTIPETSIVPVTLLA